MSRKDLSPADITRLARERVQRFFYLAPNAVAFGPATPLTALLTEFGNRVHVLHPAAVPAFVNRATVPSLRASLEPHVSFDTLEAGLVRFVEWAVTTFGPRVVEGPDRLGVLTVHAPRPPEGPPGTVPPAPPTPEPPRFVRVEEVGGGATAVVYGAYDTKMSRTVALKVPRPEYLARVGPEQFIVEANVAGQVIHPNVCTIYETCEFRGSPCIVMEFLSVSLREVLLARRSPFPIAEAVRTVIELARGAEACHTAGIVSADLKPDNIMRRECGAWVVVDFGIARIVGTGAPTGGTPHYTAPEQSRRCPDFGPPADVFALGVTLYEMLTESMPFEGITPLEIAMKVALDAPECPRVRRPDIPPALAALILRCLATNPADRPTAGELADELAAFR